MAKSLFFDHEVLSDFGLVSGSYTPKTEAEYARLEPYSVKSIAEKDAPKTEQVEVKK